MSWLTSLFSRSPEKQIERLRKKVREPHGEAAPRINAIQKLLEMGTPKALRTTLDRFQIHVSPSTQDEAEKSDLKNWLIQAGDDMVEPILSFLRTEREVYWPLEVLRGIVPEEEYRNHLVNLLRHQWENPPASPDPKAQLLKATEDVEASRELNEAVALFLDDDDDDVLLEAMDYFFSRDDQSQREKILETYLECEDRPRVRSQVLERLAESEWPVRGYRPSVEETLPEEYKITRDGIVKRLLLRS